MPFWNISMRLLLTLLFSPQIFFLSPQTLSSVIQHTYSLGILGGYFATFKFDKQICCSDNQTDRPGCQREEQKYHRNVWRALIPESDLSKLTGSCVLVWVFLEVWAVVHSWVIISVRIIIVLILILSYPIQL